VLLDALEHSVRGPEPAAHVAGVELWYDARRPAGRRVTEVRFPDGRSLERDRRYTLAVPDFLAAGGSGYDMLVGVPAEEAGAVDIDAVTRYLGALRPPVSPPAEARIHREGRS
jgi:2',3'-cyclic-nucleotide 2'-phosphodiesterase (5'-nucleotidase family)